MTVSRTDLARIIGDATIKNDVNAKKLSQEIAGYLLVNHDTNQLDSILRDVKAYRQSLGIIDVKVISAHPLDASTVNQINLLVKDYFKSYKAIIIEPVIDRDAIGGIRLEFPNQSLDLTVRAKLNKLIQTTTKGRI